ncbi:MAG: hypothetical protein AAGE94_21690 [Acidobacteriota bacterium]
MSDTTASRRLDIYRRGHTLVAVARDAEQGSIGLLFAGELGEIDREALGNQVAEWLDAARAMARPAQPLTYPDDLLPESWDLADWRTLTSEAALVVVDTVGDGHLRLRPYKNLSPIGEDFSHEGGHALDSTTEPGALGAGLRAALDVSAAISRVRQAPGGHVGSLTVHAELLDRLRQLGARLFDRPPHAEVVEVTEGFFVIPAPLRQLLFDVVWRPNSRFIEPDGTMRQITWFPLTHPDALRRWPLMSLAETADGERTVLRLDTPRPHDPLVLHVPPDGDPDQILGPVEAPTNRGQRISEWLATLEAAPR